MMTVNGGSMRFITLKTDHEFYHSIKKAESVGLSKEQIEVLLNINTKDIDTILAHIDNGEQYAISAISYQRLEVGAKILKKLTSGKKLFINPVLFPKVENLTDLLNILLSGNHSDLLYVEAFVEENDKLGKHYPTPA